MKSVATIESECLLHINVILQLVSKSVALSISSQWPLNISPSHNNDEETEDNDRENVNAIIIMTQTLGL